MSLLEMVQDILSDMNSDNVNSINDTIEAMQVARLIRSTFVNLHNDRTWPHAGQLFKLDSLTDSDRPTHMKMPVNVIEVEWVKYDSRKEETDPLNYKTIKYLTPEEFVTYVMARDSSGDYAETVMDFNGVPLIVLNNAAPSYYTSFDNEHMVFDSYDNTMDSVLRSSKTHVFGYIEPPFALTDSYVPNVPVKFFPYFLSECKSVCFLKIKEVFSQKDEQNSNRQKARLSRKKSRVDNRIEYPNYGRK